MMRGQVIPTQPDDGTTLRGDDIASTQEPELDNLHATSDQRLMREAILEPNSILNQTARLD